jgi:hypothetical protein
MLSTDRFRRGSKRDTGNSTGIRNAKEQIPIRRITHSPTDDLTEALDAGLTGTPVGRLRPKSHKERFYEKPGPFKRGVMPRRAFKKSAIALVQ